jgi:hypothetical protein
MERAYFEPSEFRISLNSFIQEARNVTFILQKNKKEIPGFDTWYAPWRKRLRADSVMKWAVDSRNRITKQGDLATESQSFITFTTDWTDQLTRRFKGEPEIPSTVLVNQVLKQIPSELISEESLLCVERRWIDSALPGRELLGVTSHALLVLSDLLKDAHSYIARVDPESRCDALESLLKKRDDYPFEIAQAEESRKVWIKADNRERIRYALYAAGKVGRKEAAQHDAADLERYGPRPILPEEPLPNTLEGAVLMYTEAAKRILTRDGHLVTFIFALESDERSLITLQLNMEDRAGKHLAIRRAAYYLALRNVNWAVMVGESWWIPLAEVGSKFIHAAQAPNRREAIAVNGVSKDGRACNRHVNFSRNGKTIIFGDEDTDAELTNIMLPIKTAITSISRFAVPL